MQFCVGATFRIWGCMVPISWWFLMKLLELYKMWKYCTHFWNFKIDAKSTKIRMQYCKKELSVWQAKFCVGAYIRNLIRKSSTLLNPNRKLSTLPPRETSAGNTPLTLTNENSLLISGIWCWWYILDCMVPTSSWFLIKL